MRQFIKRLQEQPREIKSHAALIGALGTTAIIAFVWVTTLPARFATVADGVAVTENVAALADAVESELPEAPVEKVSDAEELKNRVDTLLGDIRRTREQASSSEAGESPKVETATRTPIRIEVVPTALPSIPSTTPTTSRPVRIEVR